MFNIASILEGLEKLAFDILMWVIFVPKTLFKVLWNPDWVPQYVAQELAKKEGRFADYMSPLLLLILIVTGLYGLYEVTGLNLLEIKGPETTVVGEVTTFYASPEFRWQGNLVAEMWIVQSDRSAAQNDTSDTSYKLLRYDPDPPSHVDIDRFLAQWGEPPAGDAIVEIVAASWSLPPYRFEYTWQQPGAYEVWCAYFNSVGDMTTALPPHKIGVVDEGQRHVPVPSFDDNQTAGVFEDQERVLSVALVALALPLCISMGAELLKRQPLTRKEIQRSLYVHSMYIAPLALSVLIYAVSAFYYVLPRDWIGWEMHISQVISWASYGLAVIVFVWFLIAEARFFSQELGTSCWLGGILAAAITYGTYQVFESIVFGSRFLRRDPQLFWFGVYAIPLVLILLGLLLFKVLPNGWRWAAEEMAKRRQERGND